MGNLISIYPTPCMRDPFISVAQTKDLEMCIQLYNVRKEKPQRARSKHEDASHILDVKELIEQCKEKHTAVMYPYLSGRNWQNDSVAATVRLVNGNYSHRQVDLGL